MPTVLLIEDDPEFRTLAKSALALNNYSALEATTYEEGLDLATSRHPDLIILDVNLPLGSGMHLLAQLKGQPDTSDIPVFMLTSHNLIGEMESAFDLGANDYIMKPITLRNLAITIENSLKRL